MITMTKNEIGFENSIDGNAVCNGGIKMISRKLNKKPNNEPIYDIIKRAKEIGDRDYAIAESSVTKMFEDMMSVTEEEAFNNRETIGKTIKALNEKFDDMLKDKKMYTILADDSESPYSMRVYAREKLKEKHKNEIVYVSMRDALVRIYDAFDILVNMC